MTSFFEEIYRSCRQ